MTLPPRARIRDLVLRLLGGVHCIAFVSLWRQLDVLMGAKGLLPAAEWLGATRCWRTPSIFHLGASDGALHAGALVGVVASIALMLGLAPRLTLAVLWVLYLSFTNAGSTFFHFQWDTLLLETTCVAWFLAPWGWRPKNAPPPGPAPVFLMLGLVAKLHLESGLAKLVSGDPTWRDLTAMQSYYETAPIPTRFAWWAHQAPLWVHQATSALVLLIEIGAPALLVAPRRVRTALFALLAALQIGTELTANYGFFNLLTLVICVFVLDDSHLPKKREPEEQPAPPRPTSLFDLVVLIVWAILSVPPFLEFGRVDTRVYTYYAPLRTVNAYHLFATMTLVRREVVIEGSQDGERWESYELHYKPGDPERAPPFVAPHQPRVDFCLWFARLGGHDVTYLERLVARLLDEPDTVKSLFARMPFEGKAPRYVRVVTYQYGFTDAEARRETGAWWERELLPRETSDTFTRER